MPETLTTITFADLDLPAQILSALQKSGFTIPTPIQRAAIPHGMRGADVLGLAQTGTGKTLAFGVPMISHLRDRKGMGVVVVPTRELALQVDETLRKLALGFQLKTAVLIGGANMHKQVQQIRGGAHILIATPGRLLDHLRQGTVRLDRVGVAVLDEADRMLDMGFLPDVRRILSAMPAQRQTMLFSATMPKEIESITREFMTSPVRVEVDRTGTPAKLVDQSLLVVEMADKPETLRQLISDSEGTVLVFARTRHGARKVATLVRRFGYSSAELHSDRSLAQRREALDGFKAGKYRVLVATDIAARGIDVKRIELVVNYDVPDSPDDYIHRIGRTGRAGETGRAVMIATPQQSSMVWDVEKLIGQEIPLSPDSPLKLDPKPIAPMRRPGRNRGRRPAAAGAPAPKPAVVPFASGPRHGRPRRFSKPAARPGSARA